MVAAFDYCLHGKGGAAPSIDTAMHGLVDAAHVDHLHPDSGIAIATAADGEALTKEIFGDQVVWVPWRRPGFQLGLDIAEIKEQNPQAVGCILGGHGITAWGDTSEESERNSLWIIDTAAAYIAEHSKAEPFGPVARRVRRAARGRAPRQGRRARADHPRHRLPGPADGRPLHRLRRWCWTSWPPPSTRGWPRSARRAPTTSCAPRSSRWSSTCRPTATVEESIARLAGARGRLPRGLPGLLRPATPPPTRRRSAARTRSSCWCPASACSATARTSRPPAWPGSSTSTRST